MATYTQQLVARQLRLVGLEEMADRYLLLAEWLTDGCSRCPDVRFIHASEVVVQEGWATSIHYCRLCDFEWTTTWALDSAVWHAESVRDLKLETVHA